MPAPEDASKQRKAQEPVLLSLLITYFKLVGLLLGVWTLGYFNFSASWVFIALFIYIYNLRFRQKKEIQIDIAQDMARNEKAAILARMEDLPSWVIFPDKERVEWVNKIIMQMWPYIGDYVRQILMESVQPKIVENLPPAMKSFRFTKITLGDIAPRIGGIKAYTEQVKRDEIVLDLDLIYASDADIKVSLKGLNAGIKDLQIRGTLRVIFKPLIPVSPLIGGFTVFFLTNPTVDFNLTEIANALDIPGLSETLRGIVVEQIASFLVLPNRIPITLSEHVDYNKLKYPPPQGVLRIHCVAGKELKAADLKLMGKGSSDPYAVLKVGAQTFKTKVIQNTLEPTWNAYFEAIVDQKSGQVLEVSVFDEDPGAADYLGKCSVDIESVADKGVMNSWLPLEEVKNGMVHLRLTWLNLSANPAHLSEMTEWGDTSGLSSCILLVTADSANNLPRVIDTGFRLFETGKKSIEEPHPYVVMTVGRQVLNTQVKVSTCDPRWEENFKFLIHDPNLQTLDVEVRDKKSNRTLGTMSVLLKLLLSEERMMQEQRYTLKDSGPDSTITLALKLRVLTKEALRESDVTSFVIPPAIPKDLAAAGAVAAGPVVDIKPAAAGTKPAASSGDSNSVATPDRTAASRSSTLGKGPPSPAQGADFVKPSVSPPLQAGLSDDSGIRKRNVGHGLGRAQFTIRYSVQRSRLVVVLHKCEFQIETATSILGSFKDFLSMAGSPDYDPFAKISLIPEKGTSTKKTQTAKNTLNPVYDETFEFPVNQQDLAAKTVHISFRNSKGVFSKEKKHMGQVFVPLAALNLTQAVTEWYDLEPESNE